LGQQDGVRHYAAGNVSNAYMHGGDPASLIENARGGSGDDRIVGNQVDNRFFASAGDDSYEGGAGHDVLDAGRYGYRGSAKSLGAQGQLGFDTKGGHATLSGVEEVRFADGVLHTTQDSHAAGVYRLYVAGLDRGPDQAGQTHWTGMLDAGAYLKDLARGFLQSAEFAARFGGPDAPVDAYVSQLYRNLLHREGEDAGKAFWREQLASGRADRADVLVGFSESAENKAGTAKAVAAGVWVMDDDAPAVARLYDTVFGRQPDEAGLRNWCDRLGAGEVTLEGLAGQFMHSPVFAARFGRLDDGDFVANLYLNTLHRNSDAPGKAAWIDALRTGALDRAEVVVGFSESAEHQDLTRELNLAGSAQDFGIAFA
jgi:Ca2+-binding RTX toxin-like protein